jgi:hypothetical protein
MKSASSTSRSRSRLKLSHKPPPSKAPNPLTAKTLADHERRLCEIEDILFCTGLKALRSTLPERPPSLAPARVSRPTGQRDRGFLDTLREEMRAIRRVKRSPSTAR